MSNFDVRRMVALVCISLIALLSVACDDEAEAPEAEQAEEAQLQVEEAPPEADEAEPGEGEGDSEVPVEVVAAEFEVTETDGIFADVLYTITLRNLSDEEITVKADVDFLDEDGDVVSSAAWYNRTVPGGEEKTFTEDEVVADGAREIRVGLVEWQ